MDRYDSEGFLEAGPVRYLGSTVSLLGIRLMLTHAAACGVDVGALLAEVGLDTAILDDPERRISVRLARRLWDLGATRSEDDAFGLHVAERSGIETFEAQSYATWVSDTLEHAFERIERFYRVVGDDLELRLVRRGEWARLRRVVTDDLPQRSECLLALVTVRARELSGRAFRLHEVRFMHRAPADVRPHRALFRCPVRFSCSTAELIFAAKQLQLPVRTARPGLARVLDRHLRDLLARLPTGDTFLQRVEETIARTLHLGPPSLEATARALHASPRTVQRHLQDLGLTHRQIVEDVRRERAERLLATRGVSVSEVAFLLGFEDVSGFRRAYHKWTGKSPSRARPK